MIKNRFFMFGLGIGLIAGAMLLQLMISGGAAPMTKEDLVREAAKLNLTVTEQAADQTVQPSADPASGGQAPAPADPSVEAAGTPAASGTPASPTPSPAAAASPEAAVQPSTAAAPAKPSAPAKPASTKGQASAPAAPATPKPAAVNKTIAVKIPEGSTLTQTAEILAKAGVIQNKAEFLQTAINRKVNTKIQNGYHSFTQGESNNSIIDKLITVR